MPRRIAIHAGHVIAFDGRGHRLLRDGRGDRRRRPHRLGRPPRDRPARDRDETIEAPDSVLTPGLISTHAHIGGSPLDRSFIEDRGNPQFFYSGLFELLPVRGAAQDEEATRACVDFSMAELLRGGVTTVMEIGGASEYVVARAGDFGLRVYVGLAFRSGRWLTRDGRRVAWEWDEEQGRRGLARAIELHKQHDGAHGDLVRCFFSPAQVDTCTPDLLQASKRAADERGRPWQLHTSQSVVEFNEMLGRHGKTPVAWLRRPRRARPERDPRPRHHRRRLVVDQLPRRRRRDHGRRRVLRRPRGLGLRAARRGDGVVRRLPARRREHVARHRYESAERHRGHALGRCRVEDRRAQHRGDDRRARLRRGDPRRRPGARARRPRPHRAGRQGRSGPVEGRLLGHDAACAIR